jgi:hypothetical protein
VKITPNKSRVAATIGGGGGRNHEHVKHEDGNDSNNINFATKDAEGID